MPPAAARQDTLPHALWHPLQHLRARMQRFWLARARPSDHAELSQRNVYILPTRAGLMLVVTLATLLVSSINFQLNLGYALTFLVAGCAMVGMHMAHANLRGLQLQLSPPEPTFAGLSTPLTIRLQNQHNTPRYGLGLALLGHTDWQWTDVPARGVAQVELRFTPPQRGHHRLPPLTAETRYPLGSFRVWTVWRPATQVLAYPTPEVHPPALPSVTSTLAGDQQTQTCSDAAFDGVRAYRRGDAMKRVLWKKWAKSLTLVSRDSPATQAQTRWLDLQQCGAWPRGSATLEQQLSRLCAWVLLADHAQQPYGLRLGTQVLAPNHGASHRAACLQALALYRDAD